MQTSFMQEHSSMVFNYVSYLTRVLEHNSALPQIILGMVFTDGIIHRRTLQPNLVLHLNHSDEEMVNSLLMIDQWIRMLRS